MERLLSLRTRLLFFFIVLLESQGLCAICNNAMPMDTTIHGNKTISTPNKSFQVKQLIVPVSLITLGSIGVSNGAFDKLNHSVRDKMENLRGTHYFRVDDYVQYLPTIAYLGMGAVGLKCKNDFKRRFYAGATAYLAMGLIVNTTKYFVDEMRPDSEALNSFPSGHTATVFMGAELIRLEYGTGIAIGAYTIACGVAFLRLYNNRHWLNDVIAGAGIGILSAKIGYWMLPLYRKWWKWNNESNFLLSPCFNSQNHSLGFNIVATF